MTSEAAPAAWRRSIAHFFTHYGMAGVLALLCLYYSWATYSEQEPRGEGAARVLAARISREVPRPATILIVAKTTAEDARFAEVLENRLRNDGYEIGGRVLGDPRAVRLFLSDRAEQKASIHAIATTQECAAWTVFDNLEVKLPGLGAPRVLVAASYRWPTFLKTENLLNVANQIVVVAILAIGVTLVIISGGIDLSVGSLIALSAVLTTICVRDHGGTDASTLTMIGSGAAGILACGTIGLMSGILISAFRIPPFIATLAVMQVASGLAYILARGSSIYEVPESFTWLGRGVGFFFVPHAVVLMLVLYGIAHFFMGKTRMGRYIYAVGGNIEASWLAGIGISGVLVFVYIVSGALAGLGGVVMASQLKSGSPTYGGSYELYVIAAVVVGGTSLSGGQGRIFGTLIGALIIAVIQNGMNLTGVESYTQKVVLGLVILGAVLVDMVKRRGCRQVFRSLRWSPQA